MYCCIYIYFSLSYFIFLKPFLWMEKGKLLIHGSGADKRQAGRPSGGHDHFCGRRGFNICFSCRRSGNAGRGLRPPSTFWQTFTNPFLLLVRPSSLHPLSSSLLSAAFLVLSSNRSAFDWRTPICLISARNEHQKKKLIIIKEERKKEAKRASKKMALDRNSVARMCRRQAVSCHLAVELISDGLDCLFRLG